MNESGKLYFTSSEVIGSKNDQQAKISEKGILRDSGSSSLRNRRQASEEERVFGFSFGRLGGNL